MMSTSMSSSSRLRYLFGSCQDSRMVDVAAAAAAAAPVTWEAWPPGAAGSDCCEKKNYENHSDKKKSW